MIRVMVVDDQASARMGLSMMMGRDPGLSVVATADDGGAALAELASPCPTSSSRTCACPGRAA